MGQEATTTIQTPKAIFEKKKNKINWWREKRSRIISKMMAIDVCVLWEETKRKKKRELEANKEKSEYAMQKEILR